MTLGMIRFLTLFGFTFQCGDGKIKSVRRKGMLWL